MCRAVPSSSVLRRSSLRSCGSGAGCEGLGDAAVAGRGGAPDARPQREERARRRVTGDRRGGAAQGLRGLRLRPDRRGGSGSGAGGGSGPLGELRAEAASLQKSK